MTKITKFSIPVLLIIIAGSIFYIYQIDKRNLGLALAAPQEALIGVPFDLKVNFSNQTGTVLKNVFLTVDLPDGAVFAGNDEERRLEKKNLGDIGEGSLISETYRVVFLRGGETNQKLKANISYLPANLGASFEANGETEVAVKDSGVSVQLVGPDSVLSGQEFELDVVYKNVSDADFTGLELKLEYPPSFTFLSSSINPDQGKDTWILGDLRKGSEGTFTIRGSVIGPENAALDFKTDLKATLEGKQYGLEIKPFSLKISPSPISLTALLNEKSDYIASPGENLNYVISYVNNSDVPLRNVVIRAQLLGEMFDFNFLNTNGAFNSSNNTLVWNAQNTPALNAVAANSAGFVKFGIKAKDQYPIKRFSDKDFVLRLDAQIESPTVPGSVQAAKTFNVARLENKVSGNIVLQSRGYFRDASSGILNKGSLPPRVGQPTDFTVHWLLKNFATDISNLELRATLLNGVKFTGKTSNNFGPTPFFDDKNNQVVWQIDKLPANEGVIDDPVEIVFQLEATPSSDLVGKYMPLISDTAIKGTASFTGLDVTGSAPAVTTALPDDATVGAQGGVVQP